MSLFADPQEEAGRRSGPLPPLAERMRPRTLDELLGQEVVGEGKALRAAIESGKAGSLLLWGPPGVGKTTLALLIAQHAKLHFQPFSAVLAGVAQVREAVLLAAEHRQRDGRGTLVFVDEIHRFNKAQQDAFLPHVERGDFVLVGATTENPAFSVNGALLSRCRVIGLHSLPTEAIHRLLQRAISDSELGLGQRRLTFGPGSVQRIIALAGGDARRALGCLEACAATCLDGDEISAGVVDEAFQQRVLRHDKDGDLHYDLLSALHKSLRHSEVQAAVYWLARSIEAGADPVHVARRMVCMASEDVGLADPMALQIAVAALQAAQFLGLPEGRLPLTQAAIYLAAAPKSQTVVDAITAACAAVRDGEQFPVPLHLRNTATPAVTQTSCLPPELAQAAFYQPGGLGFEKKVQERLAELARLRVASQ